MVKRIRTIRLFGSHALSFSGQAILLFSVTLIDLSPPKVSLFLLLIFLFMGSRLTSINANWRYIYIYICRIGCGQVLSFFLSLVIEVMKVLKAKKYAKMKKKMESRETLQTDLEKQSSSCEVEAKSSELEQTSEVTFLAQFGVLYKHTYYSQVWTFRLCLTNTKMSVRIIL